MLALAHAALVSRLFRRQEPDRGKFHWRPADFAEECVMRPLRRLALIGNALPRRCGIATFTTDLHQAIATARPDLHTGVVAMTNPQGQAHDLSAAGWLSNS